MRSPPTTERRVTTRGCSATTVPMRAASRPSGCARIAASTRIGVLGRHDRDELAFVGDVERIEAEQLAGAAHLGLQRDRRLVERDAHAGGRRDLVQRAREPAARGSRMQRILGQTSSIARTSVVSSALSLSMEVSSSMPSRCEQDRDAVIAERAGDDHGVAGARIRDRERAIRRQHADAGRGDEDLIALAALDDLRVAGDDLHSGLLARSLPSTPPRARGPRSAAPPRG